MRTVPDRDAVVRLPDGRRLGAAQYGDPAGTVVFYFHGHPGARVEAGLLAGAARRAGVRLIGLDRPGMGNSDHQPDRTVRDWPADVARVADQWDIDRFAVLGFSGGAPYALACVHELADRVTGCALVSPATPVGPFSGWVAGWLPWLWLTVSGPFLRDPRRARRSLRLVSRWSPAPDRKLLAEPEILDALARSLAEALRRGARGAAHDGALLDRRWPLPPAEITAPVRLWHGELDRQVPVADARRLAADLPDCRPVWCPTEAHLSVLVHHADDILAALSAPH